MNEENIQKLSSSTRALFEARDRRFYEGTPYFSTTIRINLCDESSHDILLIVNSTTGYVNLSKLYKDLRVAAGVAERNYSDWKYTLSTVQYIDAYSLLHYGHVHFTFRGDHIYKTNNEITLNSDFERLLIKDELKHKGKLTQISALSEAPELFGENYNGYPNDIKGQYGDYHLITEMMNSISPKFKIINNEFIAFMIPHLNSHDETIIDEINDKTHQLASLLGLDEKELKELQEIQSDKTTYKGKRAERFVFNILKEQIPDIEDCSMKPHSMDLYSETLKTRFEIKCWESAEKITTNLNKFHSDCISCAENTNLFVYIDLSKRSPIEFHVETNPLRVYISLRDFNRHSISFIIQTASMFDIQRTTEKGRNITSKIIVRDIRQCIIEAMKEELKTLSPEIRSVYDEIAGSMIKQSLPKPLVDKDIQEFVDSTPEFRVGLHQKQSHPMYIEWAQRNHKLLFKKTIFYSELRKICDERRPEGIHVWILKQPK